MNRRVGRVEIGRVWLVEACCCLLLDVGVGGVVLLVLSAAAAAVIGRGLLLVGGLEGLKGLALERIGAGLDGLVVVGRLHGLPELGDLLAQTLGLGLVDVLL